MSALAQTMPADTAKYYPELAFAQSVIQLESSVYKFLAN